MENSFEKYDLRVTARRALNYVTSMVDAERDHLPYWLIGMNENPAWAEHCRVDDAELVASWYEAIVCNRAILETEKQSSRHPLSRNRCTLVGVEERTCLERI